MRSLFRGLFLRRRLERDLDEELGAYLDQLTDEKIAAGLAPDEARRAARIELGGMEQVKEDVREVRAGAFLHSLLEDLRYGLRTLGRSPGFTAAVVVTLALGIGVNTAIFGLVNAFLYKPLPGVAEPDRLVWFRRSSSYAGFRAVSDENDVFAGITALGGTESFGLSGDGRTDVVRGEFVSAEFFSVLGAEVEGRGFRAEDELPGARPVLVVSHELWQRRFGGDPGLIGRTLVVNGLRFVVVGIAGRGFGGAEVGLPRDLWVPLALHGRLAPSADDAGRDLLDREDAYWLNVVARLKDGVSLEQAQAVTVAMAQRAAGSSMDEAWRREAATLLPVTGGLDPRDRLDAVYVAGFLMAIVGLVLLIACANVAGLLLARATTRAKEMGVRQALGASRPRIVRQLLTESFLVALGGGALGLLLATWTVSLFAGLARATPITPPALDVDGRVLAFALVASCVTALACGLAPALQASRIDVMSALTQEGAALGSRFGRTRLRKALVVAQVSLALPLLIGAGLFTRSLANGRDVDPGFVVANGLLADIDPGVLRRSPEQGEALYRRALDSVSAMPGVERASLVHMVPLGMSAGAGTVTSVGGEPRSLATGFNIVGPGYFATMGIPIVRGRELGLEDRAGAAAVVVVNQTLARELYPDEDPVGKRVRFGEDEPTMEIVGVVADSKYGTLGERDRPFLFQPLGQSYRGKMTLVVRTQGDPGALVDALAARLHEVEPDLPVSGSRTLAAQVELALVPARAGALLMGGFGLLALLLAGIGVYSMVAYSVSQRVRELGIRMALGATRGDLVRLVVGGTFTVVGVGIAIGLVLSFLLAEAVRSFLYGVVPGDPLTFLGISGLLLGVAALASYLPARRAASVDPMVSLRFE